MLGILLGMQLTVVPTVNSREMARISIGIECY